MWDELEVDQSVVIGEGGFGRVFKGRWNSTTVAVKQLTATALDDHDLRKGACPHPLRASARERECERELLPASRRRPQCTGRRTSWAI